MKHIKKFLLLLIIFISSTNIQLVNAISETKCEKKSNEIVKKIKIDTATLQKYNEEHNPEIIVTREDLEKGKELFDNEMIDDKLMVYLLKFIKSNGVDLDDCYSVTDFN